MAPWLRPCLLGTRKCVCFVFFHCIATGSQCKFEAFVLFFHIVILSSTLAPNIVFPANVDISDHTMFVTHRQDQHKDVMPGWYGIRLSSFAAVLHYITILL